MDNWISYFAERPTDWLLVLFSGLLALFTWRLWVSTNRLFSVTKVAADAADLSARTAIGIELPILRAVGSQIELIHVEEGTDLSGPYGGATVDSLPGRYSAISNIEIKNFGRTHAFPIEIALGYAVTNSLPADPAYRQTLKRAAASVIPPNETVSLQIHYGIRLSAEEEAAAQAERAPLWFYFSIIYRDFMSNKHEARFCYQWGRPDGIGGYYFVEGNAPVAYSLHT